MKQRDLLSMCKQNLLRRKGRTLLTVLGVTIGTCAIIIMVSIGIGMKESQEKMLSEMGDLTLINVSPAPPNVRNAIALDDKALRSIAAMPGVTMTTPKLTADDLTLKITAGRDKRFVSDYAAIVGMDRAAVQKLGYKVTSGAFLSAAPGEVLVGDQFAYMFKDTKRPEGYNMVDTGGMYTEDEQAEAAKPDPYFDPMRTPLQLEVELTVSGKTVTKSYPLKVMGIMKSDYAKGNETVDGVLMTHEALTRILRDAKPGGNTRNRRGYPQAIVKVDGISRVAPVEEQIKALGFQTSSMESIRKPMEKEAQQKQMMLGGLGAISLLVAALGITNTMIMSISERTREIGIMKALGCRVRDVRTLFLLEAGSIGLLGGVFAVLISMLASAVMNIVQSGQPPSSFEQVWQVLTTPGSRMSVIPLWLLVFSLVFSVFIGLFSGFHPANRAVRIPALEAIKSE